MQVLLTEAKAKLTDLGRRAGARKEIVLTPNGKPSVRLADIVPVHEMIEALLARLGAFAKRGACNALPGRPADRTADFLHDQNGLPKRMLSKVPV